MGTAEQAPAVGGGYSRWLVLTVVCVGYLLVLLEVTVINSIAAARPERSGLTSGVNN